MPKRRLSAAEEEIQSYLRAAKSGQAGVNPKAQTMARSKGNWRVSREGQALVDDQLQQNERNRAIAERDATRAAEDQAQAAEKARQDAEKQRAAEASAAEARRIRAGAAAGMQTTTDIETGRRTIATHPDGTPKWKAGAVGEPYQQIEDRSVSIPKGFLGSEGVEKPATRKTWVQDYRDDRGQTVTEPLPVETDPKTGDRYVEKADSFGRQQRVTVGRDAEIAQKQAKLANIAQAKDQIALAKNQIAQEQNVQAQARAGFDPRWKQAEADFEEAQKEFDSLKGKVERVEMTVNGQTVSRMVDSRGRPLSDSEVAAHKQALATAQGRLARATAARDALAPEAARLDSVDKQLAERKSRVDLEGLKLTERQIRLEGNLPDSLPSEFIQQATAGEDPEAVEPTPRQREQSAMLDEFTAAYALDRALSAPDASPYGDPNLTSDGPVSENPEELARQQAMGEARRGLAEATAQDRGNPAAQAIGLAAQTGAPRQQLEKFLTDRQAKALFPFAEGIETRLNVVNDTEVRGADGYLYGTLDRENGVSTITLQDTMDRARGQMSPVTPDNVLVYNRYSADRMNPSEASAYVIDTLEQTSDPNLEPGALGEIIQQQGATLPDLASKFEQGILPFQQADYLAKQLYGVSLAATPRDEAAFESWVRQQTERERSEGIRESLTTAARWAKASSKKGVQFGEQNDLRASFLRDWYLENRWRPNVSRSQVQAAMGYDTSDSASTIEKLRSARNKTRSLIVDDVLGSMGGMVAGAFKDLGAAEIALMEKIAGQGTDATDELKKSLRMRNRDFASWTNSTTKNLRKWTNGDGRERADHFDRLVDGLQKTIDAQQESGEINQAGLDKAVQAVMQAALDLHDLAPDEGWPVTLDNLDPNKDVALGNALARYAAGGDPRDFDAFKERLLMGNGRRQFNAELEKMAGMRGSKFEQAFTGGMYVGWQEFAIEIAADGLAGLTGGLSKEAQMAVRTGSAARKGAMMRRLGRMVDAFERWGIREGTLARPLTVADKARNIGARTLKAAPEAVLGEAMEEVVAEAGSDNPDFANAALVGGLGGIVLAPSFAGVSYLGGRFAEKWNKTADAEPITGQTASNAAGYLRPDEFAARVEAIQGDLPAAGMEVDPALQTRLDNLRGQINKAEAALENASPDRATAIEAQLEAMRADEATLAEQVGTAESTAQARARIDQQAAALVAAQEDAISVERTIESFPEQDRAFWRAVMKVAVGNEAALTDAERQAVAGASTTDGLPYFEDSAEGTRLTEAGRDALVARIPDATNLIKPYEPRTAPAAPEAQAQAQPEAVEPQAPAQEPGAAGVRPADQGGGDAAPAAGGAAGGDVAGSEIPENRPQIPENRPDFAENQRGFQENQGGSDEIPTEADADALAASLQAEAVAEEIKAKIEAAMPILKGHITVGEESLGGGGAQATASGVTISVPDLAEAIGYFKGDTAAAADWLEETVRKHEVIHVAQFESVRHAWELAGKPGTYDEFFFEWYERIHGELSDEIKAAARNIYGDAAWDASDKASQAAEVVRMLVEAKLSPDERFSELLRVVKAQRSPTLIETIRLALESLVRMLKEGLLPESAREHVAQVEALYRELAGEPAGKTKEADPATPLKPTALPAEGKTATVQGKGNEVAGWQARNTDLGKRFRGAKAEVDAIEAKIQTARDKDAVTLPEGFETIPYPNGEGQVVLQDADGNDIAYPLTPQEASSRAWEMAGGDQFAVSGKLAKRLQPALERARKARDAASAAWDANGENPMASQLAEEARRQAEAEQKKREAVAKGKRTRAAKKAAKKQAKPAEPELSEGDKKARKVLDGLFASKAPQDFTRPIPPDRMAALMDAAATWFQEGVTTPEALAGKLDALAEDGKARPFSQSFWFALKAVGAQGPAEPNWSEAYAKPETVASPEAGRPTTDEKKSVGLPEKPKRRRQIDTPARRKAFEQLATGEYDVLKTLIDNGAQITPPPPQVALIKKKVADKARPLTNSEQAVMKANADYNGVIFKNQLPDTPDGKAAREVLGMLMARKGEGRRPDKVAGSYREGWTADQLWTAIRTELHKMARGRQQSKLDPTAETPDAAEIAKAEITERKRDAQDKAFDKANTKANGVPMPVDEFTRDMVGQTITVDGEPMVVKSVEWNDFLGVAQSVTLEDGTRFGRQVLEDGEAVFVEIDATEEQASPAPESGASDNTPAVASATDSGAGDQITIDDLRRRFIDEHGKGNPDIVKRYRALEQRLGENGIVWLANDLKETGGYFPIINDLEGNVGYAENYRYEWDPETPKPWEEKTPAPASAMDRKNADSRELFADDGGFALTGETTQDGDKIAAERKAKEEAKAAQDAAQTDMFSGETAGSAAGNTPSTQPARGTTQAQETAPSDANTARSEDQTGSKEPSGSAPENRTFPQASPSTVTPPVTRSKPRQMIEFSKPITGPSGQSLVAYEWQYRLEEDIDRRGENVTRRVSDWEKAETNAETGRDVVHQFHVRGKDGKTQTVSLETALSLLGYTTAESSKPIKSLASTLKTRAKNQMEADRLAARIAEIDAARAEVEKLPFPEITEETETGEYGANKGKTATLYVMGDVKTFPNFRNDPYFLRDQRSILEIDWRAKRMKERGMPATSRNLKDALEDVQKRIKRADKKIKEATEAAQPEPAAAVDDFAPNADGIPDLPIRGAEAVAHAAYAGQVTQLERKLFGNGVEPSDWTKPKQPGMIQAVSDEAKAQGWKMRDVEERARIQLGLDETFAAKGTEERKYIDHLKARVAKLYPEDAVEAAAAETDTDPSDAQKSAGNYRKGKVTLHGLTISIENPAGSTRSGTDPGGQKWEVTLPHHYGYIVRVKGETATKGKDGDHVDVFVGPNPESTKVFIVNQTKVGGKGFDEHKVMLGFDSRAAAIEGYINSYSVGWRGLGDIVETSVGRFRRWLDTPGKAQRPAKKADFDLLEPYEMRPVATASPLAIRPKDGVTRADIEKELKAGQSTGNYGLVTASKVRLSILTGDPALIEKTILEEMGIRAPVVRDGNDLLLSVRTNQSMATLLRTLRGSFNALAAVAADGQQAIRILGVKGDAKADAAPAIETPTVDVETVAVNEPAPRETQAPEASTGEEQAALPGMSAPGKIEDFGEKIGGARKDLWGKFGMAMRAELPDDAKDITLAKHFPAPDVEQLLKDGVAEDDVIRVLAMRDEIPAKPRSKWKLNRWAEQVKLLRDGAQAILNGESQWTAENIERLDAILKARLAIYRAAGVRNIAKLGKINPRISEYVSYSGTDASYGNPLLVLSPQENRSYWIRDNNDVKLGLKNDLDTPEKLQARLDEAAKKVADNLIASNETATGKPEAPKKGKNPYNLYRDRFTSEIFVGRKGANGVVRMREKIADVAEGRRIVKEEREDLDKEWEAMKQPPVLRRAHNAPRQGPKRREGHITPEVFGETFGFRGVEFGNWVEDTKRQGDLNEAYDALLDMAEALGVPPRALSLDGSLGLAFGARGTGGKQPAAAHYEPSFVVINLTKKSGPGSLAHEWWHAFDNYMARLDQTGETTAKALDRWATTFRGMPKNMRKEIFDKFGALRRAIAGSEFEKRSQEADKARSKAYFGTMIEMTARAFEAFMVEKLASLKIANDYLVNTYGGAAEYPTTQELEGPIGNAYRDLMGALQTVETDSGIKLFSSKAPDSGGIEFSPNTAGVDAAARGGFFTESPRVGRTHALNAFRALTAKRAKVGLTPAETETLATVEAALAERLTGTALAASRAPEQSSPIEPNQPGGAGNTGDAASLTRVVTPEEDAELRKRVAQGEIVGPVFHGTMRGPYEKSDAELAQRGNIPGVLFLTANSRAAVGYAVSGGAGFVSKAGRAAAAQRMGEAYKPHVFRMYLSGKFYDGKAIDLESLQRAAKKSGVDLDQLMGIDFVTTERWDDTADDGDGAWVELSGYQNSSSAPDEVFGSKAAAMLDYLKRVANGEIDAYAGTDTDALEGNPNLQWLFGDPDLGRAYVEEAGFQGVAYRDSEVAAFADARNARDNTTYVPFATDQIIPANLSFDQSPPAVSGGPTLAASPAPGKSPRRSDPLLDEINALIRDPDRKAEVYAKMRKYVSEVRSRFENNRLKREFARDGGTPDRWTQIRDVAILEAVAKALPPELRGKLVGSFRRLDELKTEKGRENYLLKMLPKIEAALENHLRKLYRLDIRKVLDKSQPRPNESRNVRGKIGAVGHAIARQAIEAMTEEPGIAMSKAAAYRLIVETGRDSEGNPVDVDLEKMDELEGKAMALELFADYDRADSARLERALEFLRNVYAASREEWLGVLKERKMKRDSEIAMLRKALNAPDFITEEMLGAARDKAETVKDKLASGLLEWISSAYQVLDRLKERTTDKVALAWVDEQQAKLRKARGAYDDRVEADRVALEQAMQRIFQTREGWRGLFQLDPILYELSKRTDESGVTVLEGFRTEDIPVPISALESLVRRETSGYDYNGKTYEITDADMPKLLEAYERFNELPEEAQRRARRIVFERVVSTGRRGNVGKISQLEGLKEWLAMRQPDAAEKYANIGWDEQTFEELDRWLKPEVKELGLWLVDRLEQQSAELDAKHRAEYGIGLDLVENYFPLLFETAGDQDATVSPDGVDVAVRAKTASGLKARIQHRARPRRMNALSVFLSNRAQIHYFMTHASPLREMVQVFRARESNEAMRATLGAAYARNLSKELTLIETNGMMAADGVLEAERFVRKVQSGYALSVLGMKLKTLAINTTALLNPFLGVGAGKILKGFTPEYIADLRRFFDSPGIQRRLKHGTSHEVRIASQGGIGGHPLAAGSRRLAKGPMEAINWWDTFSNGIFGAAVFRATYEEARAAGLSEDAAMERANEAIDELSVTVMQPNNLLSRSLGEAKLTQNPIGGLLFLFASEMRKNFAIGIYAARKAITGKGAQSYGMAWQQLVTLGIFYSALGYLIRSAYEAIFRAEDDEPEEILARFKARMSDPKAWAHTMATEHLRGIPLIGEALNHTSAAIFDQESYDSSPNPLNRAVRGFGKVSDIMDGDNTPEERAQAVIDAVQGTVGMTPETALLAQVGNVFEDALGLLTSNGMEISREERIRRFKRRFSTFQRDWREENGNVGENPGLKFQRDTATVEWLTEKLAPLSEEDRRAFLEEIDSQLNSDVRMWVQP